MSARIARKILLVILLIPVIFIGALFSSIEVFAEEIEYATLSEEEINSIVEEVNYREQSRNQSRVQLFSLNGSSEKKSSRTLIIRDFNENKAFLYIEFDLGGYAIYDRLGTFIYERKEYGDGPYSGYTKQNKLYYGGPYNYYVKVKNGYQNIETNTVISKKQGKQLTLTSTDTAREQEIAEKQELESNASANISARATIEWHYLGERLKDDLSSSNPIYHDLAANVGLYFPMIIYKLSTTSSHHLDIFDFGAELGGKDCLVAINKHGTCVFVALASVMSFYTKFQFADMYPTNLDNLRIAYDYYLKGSERINAPVNVIDEGVGYTYSALSDVSRSIIKTELLHQELIKSYFPNINLDGLQDDPERLGITNDQVSPVVSKYYENNPTATYKQFISRNKSSGLIEVVREGDPAIIAFNGSYRYGNSTQTTKGHAVICMGYSQKKFGLIHSVDEYSVFSGWNIRNKGELLITKSVILNNYSFKVLS